MKLNKYSIGIGDRFGQQGSAQLSAVMKAMDEGVEITPVWNKSYREHQIIGTHPDDTRREADAAVKACGWNRSYFVDADHVGLGNVDFFLDHSDFFTIDVADFITRSAGRSRIESFVQKHRKYRGRFEIPGMRDPLTITEKQIQNAANKFLCAVEEANRIYRHIFKNKKNRDLIVEVSMDETDAPQTPVELFFILAAVAQEGIPVQTIAPKFTGRFNKGVDYVGNTDRFIREFEQDLAVIAFAVQEFALSPILKLSVHSGSDKFAIYEPIRRALKKYDAGLHLKTAGTTWLEELTGLAEAGGEGLKIAKDIYRGAFFRRDELCKPYASVIDIDADQLPLPDRVEAWDTEAFGSALRHDASNKEYNRHFRQLLHVGYRVAAELGDRYLNALREYEGVIARNVRKNLYERHIQKLFM